MTIDVGIYQGIEERDILGVTSNVLHVIVIMDTDPYIAYRYTKGFSEKYRREILWYKLDPVAVERAYAKVIQFKKENKKSGKWTNTFLSNPAKYINQLPLKSYRNED